MVLCVPLGACFTGTGNKDALRQPVSQTGISVGLQVNLPLNTTQADAVASIYKDGTRQPLVGGDFFQADTSTDSVMLTSLENLSGDYRGKVSVTGSTDPVTLSTQYDPVKARQDRWYPVDQLLIDPGPNEDLVGYSETVTFPAPLRNLTINSTTYTSRSDNIVLNWDAANGDQMNTTSVVTCHTSDGNNYTYPLFYVLGNVDSAGTYTLPVGDIIPNTNIINAVATLANEVAAIITASVINASTYGLVTAKNIPLATVTLKSCDVDMTVYRENGFALPPNVKGGYAISSTSDTVHFTGLFVQPHCYSPPSRWRVNRVPCSVFRPAMSVTMPVVVLISRLPVVWKPLPDFL